MSLCVCVCVREGVGKGGLGGERERERERERCILPTLSHVIDVHNAFMDVFDCFDPY